MNNWRFLSYQLNSDAFGYGNGDRFEMSQIRSMCCGDTSNNSAFKMPTHYGTHIDYPFHFSDKGKTSSDYQPKDFIFDQVGIIEIEGDVENYLIRNINLNLNQINKNCQFLIIKTGFCSKRHTQDYWEYGFGFHPKTASYLKQALPHLKAIGFDLISLNSYQNRPIGREAHKAFLIENDILILEEMDLINITKSTKINQLIVAPLLLEKADGAPCTIFANIND